MQQEQKDKQKSEILQEGDAVARKSCKSLRELEHKFEQSGSWMESEKVFIRVVTERLMQLQLKVDGITDPRLRDHRKKVTLSIQRVIAYADYLLAREDFMPALQRQLLSDMGYSAAASDASPQETDGKTKGVEWEGALRGARLDTPGRLRRGIMANTQEWQSLAIPRGVRLLIEVRMFGSVLPFPRGQVQGHPATKTEWSQWWFQCGSN